MCIDFKKYKMKSGTGKQVFKNKFYTADLTAVKTYFEQKLKLHAAAAPLNNDLYLAISRHYSFSLTGFQVFEFKNKQEAKQAFDHNKNVAIISKPIPNTIASPFNLIGVSQFSKGTFLHCEAFYGRYIGYSLPAFYTIFNNPLILNNSSNNKASTPFSSDTDYSILVTFEALAQNDIHICFFTQNSANQGYEVVIGGWGNSMSVIRNTFQGYNLCENKQAKDQCTSNVFDKYWVQYEYKQKEQRVKYGKGEFNEKNTACCEAIVNGSIRQ